MMNPQAIYTSLEFPGNKQNFETTLLEAIDEIFSSFGNNCKRALYLHLKDNYEIKKKEVPRKIQDFADAIEEIFGAGSRLLEMRIIEALHEKVQDFVYFPQKDLVFTEYVTSLGSFLTP